MVYRILSFILMTLMSLVCSGCSECKPDCNWKCCGDDGCGGKCKDTCADSDLLCNPFTCTCANCIEGCTSNEDCEIDEYCDIQNGCICRPLENYCESHGSDCKTDADCPVGEHCAVRFPDCVCDIDCGEPDGDSCPPGCQAVSGFLYVYECYCGYPRHIETLFCRSPSEQCAGPSQFVQSPSGRCYILDQGCDGKLPSGWLRGCCDLPDTPAPDFVVECEGCTSDSDCGPYELCDISHCSSCVLSVGCNFAPSQELVVPCGGDNCLLKPCNDTGFEGVVCSLPWWARNLEEGEVGLSYAVDGQTYTSWDQIVDTFGRCTSAFYLIEPRNLTAEGYVSERVYSSVCLYPVECGDDDCYFETTFCCTDLSAGGEQSCRTYDEILPARKGVTVNLDQRTCALP